MGPSEVEDGRCYQSASAAQPGYFFFFDRLTGVEVSQDSGSLMVRKIFQPSAPSRRKSMLRNLCTSAVNPG
jgi:hypothetical protein